MKSTVKKTNKQCTQRKVANDGKDVKRKYMDKSVQEMKMLKDKMEGLIEESDAEQESGRKIKTLKGILNLLLSDKSNTKENIKVNWLAQTVWITK